MTRALPDDAREPAHLIGQRPPRRAGGVPGPYVRAEFPHRPGEVAVGTRDRDVETVRALRTHQLGDDMGDAAVHRLGDVEDAR